MNFLEQLVAEWFSYNGYFVQTNVKFGPLKLGGYEGEMDVVALHPRDRILVHIETSTDSYSWEKRERHFKSKFTHAQEYYSQLFNSDFNKIEKVVIVGLRKTTPDWISFGEDVTILTIPAFINSITDKLRNLSPLKKAVPEQWPLIRVLQISSYFSDK
jgi:hypothetical protein